MVGGAPGGPTKNHQNHQRANVAAGRCAGGRGGKENGGLQSRQKVFHKIMRSSPHPKPPMGDPREAVGDLMGLKGKMVGGPFWKLQKT